MKAIYKTILFFQCLLCFTCYSQVVDRFELVALDASNLTPTVGVGNSWGGHQTRITRDNNGNINILYLRQDAAGVPQWRLMQRNSFGQWSEQASGPTIQDAYLLQDQIQDKLTVIAWPDKASSWSSPSFTEQAIPGTWISASQGNHYGGAGIGSNGTICLKECKDNPNIPYTSSTNTRFITGLYTTSSIAWNSFVDVNVGNRHAYDYIFPSTQTPSGNGILAIAQRDLYKDAEPMPNLTGFAYVFNGGKMWWSVSNSIQDCVIVNPIIAPTATIAPLRRLNDSYLDNIGRVFSSYMEQDPMNPTNNGIYLTVTNSSDGHTFFKAKLPLPTYGYTRFYEDNSNQMWVLWTNKGTQVTQMNLYKLIQSGFGNNATFSLGTSYDLSSNFYPYAITGRPFLAVPRGGTPKSNFIEGVFCSCSVDYTVTNYSSSICYNSNGLGKEKVFYFRINLQNVTSISANSKVEFHEKTVFPIPADKYLNIDLAFLSQGICTYTIYDVYGKEINSKIVNQTDKQIDTSTLQNGIYILTLQNDFEKFTRKFIVQH